MQRQQTIQPALNTRTRFDLKYFLRHKWLYLMCVPGLIYLLIFKYVPMFGLRIAFMEYNQYNPSASG